MCRICFSGVEEEPTLGRLFSPCKCSGTMKYVHIKCLDTWRYTGGRKENFYECTQCKYKYNLLRTSFSSFFENQSIFPFLFLSFPFQLFWSISIITQQQQKTIVFVHTLTVIMFITIILLAGYLAKVLLLFIFSSLYYFFLNWFFFVF